MEETLEFRAADIDERAIRFDDPQQLVRALAQAKASALIPSLERELDDQRDIFLITCDQVGLSLFFFSVPNLTRDILVSRSSCRTAQSSKSPATRAKLAR